MGLTISRHLCTKTNQGSCPSYWTSWWVTVTQLGCEKKLCIKAERIQLLGDIGFWREWKEYKPDSGLDSSSLIKCERVSESLSVMSDSLRPHGPYSPWNSPGQNTGVGSLSLLQGIFPTQGSNPGLPHCRRILYQLSHNAGTNHSTAVSLNFQICKMRRWVRWSLRFLLVLSSYESGARIIPPFCNSFPAICKKEESFLKECLCK